MNVLDSIAAPGADLSGRDKRGAGDDRFGFDEAAGTAWVLDGATDVGAIRLFPEEESDAAHFAELMNQELASFPPASRPLDAYFAEVVRRVRARAEADSRIPLAQAPKSCWPTAAGVWVRIEDDVIEGACLGDSLGLVQTPGGDIHVIGKVEQPAEESERARRVLALSPQEQMDWLRRTREIHNTEGGYWVFGLQPEAVSHITRFELKAARGARILLMTDGFYRLVSPYGRMDDRTLLERAFDDGLGQLMTELRSLETSSADDARIGRFKRADDATALTILV